MAFLVKCRTADSNLFLMPHGLDKLNSHLQCDVIQQLSRSEQLCDCDRPYHSFLYARSFNTPQVFKDL